MRFVPAVRRFTLTTHVASSVGWVGAVLVFVALAGIGLSSQDEGTVRGAYLVMAPAAWFVLVPLAHVSLFSGIVLALATPWGLFLHYWVVWKFGITAFCTAILIIYMGTFRQLAGVAADPVVELGLVRSPSPFVHAILALILLLLATWLGVYKPFGLTPYGARRQIVERPPALVAITTPQTSLSSSAGDDTPKWMVIAGVVALVLMLVVALLHLAGARLRH